MSISPGLVRRTGESAEEGTMTATAEHRMIVAMLAEGHPVWYVAAMVRKHSREVEAVAESYGPDRRRLRRAAARLAA
jgi:N-acyl-D-aspartate/D-glutamate deacylase